MPVDYEIDASRRRIRTRLVGLVTLDEVLAHLRTLEADPRMPEQPDVLLDFRELTSFPDHRQVQSVAHAVRGLAPKLAWRHCAIVARQDLAFAIGRMFEMISEPAFRATMVFRRLDEAEHWLERSARGPAA